MVLCGHNTAQTAEEAHAATVATVALFNEANFRLFEDVHAIGNSVVGHNEQQVTWLPMADPY